LTIEFGKRDLRSIEGWMSDEELKWLETRASMCTRVVEVGSHMGRSTRALVTGCKGRVYSVDRWDSDLAFDAFCINMHDALDSNLLLFKGNSTEVASLMAGSLFDAVFIDADHSYEGVAADLHAWEPKVRKGGILCGHDYDPYWPGVIKAVNERFASSVKRGPGSIWFVEI
jgi:predicted O-methyltransferase YrrM